MELTFAVYITLMQLAVGQIAAIVPLPDRFFQAGKLFITRMEAWKAALYEISIDNKDSLLDCGGLQSCAAVCLNCHTKQIIIIGLAQRQTKGLPVFKQMLRT